MSYERQDFHRDLARAARRVDDDAAPAVAAAAPVAIVYGHDSAETHVAYRSARRTLCGVAVRAALHGRGQHGRPSCRACSAALKAHRLGGLVGAPPARCLALTRAGTPCQRAPRPNGYCPSHPRADG